MSVAPGGFIFLFPVALLALTVGYSKSAPPVHAYAYITSQIIIHNSTVGVFHHFFCKSGRYALGLNYGLIMSYKPTGCGHNIRNTCSI